MSRAAPEVIEQDAELLVCEKPAGLLSVPGRGPALADCALARLEREHGPLHVVHRLDRDTSGLLLFARSVEALRALAGQFERREVRKRYRAVVRGDVVEAAGVIDAPLGKDWERPPRHRVDRERGRASQTEFVVLERGEGRTRVELVPITGRSHQLRVHLAFVGHPIVGDPLYDPESSEEPGPAASGERLLLHATELAVRHPRTGAWKEWRSGSLF
jgi:tRNA pseudouridine32 synthase/23S rRNA pseudouridine746 synthase